MSEKAHILQDSTEHCSVMGLLSLVLSAQQFSNVSNCSKCYPTASRWQALAICLLKALVPSFQYVNPLLMKAGSLLVLARNLFSNSTVMQMWQKQHQQLRCNAASRTCQTTLFCMIAPLPWKQTFAWETSRTWEDGTYEEEKAQSN